MNRRLGTKRISAYLFSIIGFFLLPSLALFVRLIKKTNLKAFGLTLAAVLVLGAGWSSLVSAEGWWSFNPEIMLGIKILTWLPLEEILFYPLGGALSILLYVAFQRPDEPSGRRHRFFFRLMVFLALMVSGLIAWSTILHGRLPFYVLSQLILFDGLCFGLWSRAQPQLRIRSLFLTIGVMALLGFFWNWMAFSRGWWEYHAVLGWMWPAGVPIDDFNFYFFAPLAAVSLYSILAQDGRS